MEQGSTNLDHTRKEFVEYFPGLDSAISSETPVPGIPLELAFPPPSPDPEHPFEFPFLDTPLNIRSAQEPMENTFFASHDVLSWNTSPQFAFSPDELNISVDSASTFLSPSPTMLPTHAITFDPPKWRKIPQVPYDQGKKQLHFARAESIIFQVDGYPGVNLAEALRERVTGLKNRDDFVLQDGRKTFSCRLQFPGYPPNKSSQVPTKSWKKTGDPIIRSKLAFHVARKLKQYLDSMSGSHPAGGLANNEWTIGQGFIRFENMYLAELISVSEGSFQPEIWVMDPTV